MEILTGTDTPPGAAPGGRVSASGAVLTGPAAAGGRTALVPQLLVAVLCGGYAVGAALGWGSPALAQFMGDFGLSAAALTACGSCLWYARAVPGRNRPAWVLFAVSSAMVAAGNGVWGWYEVVLRQPVPRASAADFCFLLFAPPAIVGLLVLAKRPVNRAGWICLGLDAWLIGGSLLTLTWSLALARTAQWDGRSTARIALSLAYPVLDIMLVSMVLVLHFRRSSANRSAVNTAIAALALTVLCDALFTSPLLREHYRSGQILDAGWFAGSILLAYAPWVGKRETSRRTVPPRGSPEPRGAGSLGALTPYLAAAVCTLGILYNVLDDQKIDRVVLFTGCTVALVLVARQGIMLLDNIALTQELAQKENHFRSLVQGSSDVIMIAAHTGVLRYVSPAAKGVYGRDAEQMVGTELASHIHPEDLGRVLHEVRRFLAASPAEEPATRIECRIRSGDGGWLNVESSVNRYQGGLIFNSRDVTERVRLQAQLQHNASHDPLTDLPNRALFAERVRQALGGRRADDGEAAVLYIDLDGFKAVNDTVGHQAGDELLIQAARRLQESVRAGDTAARLGGDEFAALICGGTGDRHVREQQIVEIAERLRMTLSEPYAVLAGTAARGPSDGGRGTAAEHTGPRVGETTVRVAASIGVAFAGPGIGPAELMRNADLAMYRAKSAGKNRVELYAPQMQAEVAHRAELAERLRTALDRGEFTLLHQPVVDLESGVVDAVEAQARWRSAQGILFTPAEFLRLADNRREVDEDRAEVSRWMLEQAVEQAAHRHRMGHRVPVSVRMSARRLMGRDLPPRTVESLLARHELPAGALMLALTGHDPGICLDELERRLLALRRAGVTIALEGFGTGYAGMLALRRLPVDVVRLDRALTADLVESARVHKITAGLLRIARDLGLRSVADGVDRPEQVVALREMGCTHGQGMAFAGPLDEPRLRGSLARGGYPVPLCAERDVVPAGSGAGLRGVASDQQNTAFT
ncbi:putative bifunctional diguanylate cyclase/phosphodiesterase [Streptantibioticus rubrisoli]|uniref:putative bifunctional diguanylate cyclase/phosphodiesterase n=1 Tax=Streptantibioticus rubrisoli TaxID=1387313 RepID=UPI0026E533AE|nr:EAL domain-containing protein [Streptantibioticus rubrisoli]